MKSTVVLNIFGLIYLFASANSGSVTIDEFYTSCTQNFPLGGGLANLSYGKSSATFVPSWTCSSLTPTQPYQATITWYYYPVYLDNGVCQHSTITSTISLNVITNINVNGTAIVTLGGTVTAGKFDGFTVESVLTLPQTNFAACSSTIGMEALSGTAILTLTNLNLLSLSSLICNGIHTETYCPGLN